MGQGRGGATHTKQHKNSLPWSPVEEYTSCIEGAGCSRKSLQKQLSVTVKVKGKRFIEALKLPYIVPS